MTLSIPHVSIPVAASNKIAATVEQPPVANPVENPPPGAQTSDSSALDTHHNQPPLNRSAPFMGSLLEHRISKRAISAKHYVSTDVLMKIKQHFREYAAGQNDRFVNVGELKEAAGQKPTSRTFSAEATLFAKVLLQDPKLLRELDIGTDGYGGPGAEDGRFDMENLDYLITKLNNGLGIRLTPYREK